MTITRSAASYFPPVKSVHDMRILRPTAPTVRAKKEKLLASYNQFRMDIGSFSSLFLNNLSLLGEGKMPDNMNNTLAADSFGRTIGVLIDSYDKIQEENAQFHLLRLMYKNMHYIGKLNQAHLVGRSFLRTLQQTLGEHLDDESLDEWVDFYVLLIVLLERLRRDFDARSKYKNTNFLTYLKMETIEKNPAEVGLWKRRFEFEKERRREAERVLETKSLELYKTNQALKEHNEELLQVQEELRIQREQIAYQYEKLIEINHNVQASIRSAQIIQNAMMPKASVLKEYVKDYFLMYRPLQIVSGDFYWVFHKNNVTYIALADCTGHGVPGAFMSVIGLMLLERIIGIQEFKDTEKVLEELNSNIIHLLQQNNNANRDGMDIALLAMEHADSGNKRISFSGARANLYYWKKSEGQLCEVEGSRRTIGGVQVRKTDFAISQLELSPGDKLILSTDGFKDQNNELGKRLGSVRFKAILQQIAPLPMPEQVAILQTELYNHMGQAPQRDDICVMGIEI